MSSLKPEIRMHLVVYDHSFEGLLTAVFDIYRLKLEPRDIVTDKVYQDDIFTEKHVVVTDEKRAHRVWKGIKKRASKQMCEVLYRAFLSEIPGIEMTLYRTIRLILDSPQNVELDFSNKYVLEVNKICRKVTREAERLRMFLRFQETSDGVYYASVDPRYDVLTMVIDHFKDRFADQQWVIYDTRRDYGFYYDMKEVCRVTFSESRVSMQTGKVDQEIMHEKEVAFQKLWKTYFNSVNIEERKNLKVHLQFLPKRFWKYLPEKDDSL